VCEGLGGCGVIVVEAHAEYYNIFLVLKIVTRWPGPYLLLQGQPKKQLYIPQSVYPEDKSGYFM